MELDFKNKIYPDILNALKNDTTYYTKTKNEPNNVLIVVPVKLIDVPITVLETFVPSVVVVFNLSASAVLIPTPVKLDNNLTSAIVTV